MKYVVDTNVAVAANGRDTHASNKCQVACIEFLQKLTDKKSSLKIVVDDKEQVLDEYKCYLNYKGSPGVGDLFYKYLHDHQYSSTKVRRISITPINDNTRGFDELPANTMDPSDRKFLALAVADSARVANALDSDWMEQNVLMGMLGVIVRELCPENLRCK